MLYILLAVLLALIGLKSWPFWFALAVGIIGLQRAVVQTILVTAAGATAQTGDAYAIPQDWSSSDVLMYQIIVSGGTFSALHTKLALSLDGLNFPSFQVDDTSLAGAVGVVQMGTTLNNVKAPFVQASISGGTVATGSPVVTVKLWPR